MFWKYYRKIIIRVACLKYFRNISEIFEILEDLEKKGIRVPGPLHKVQKYNCLS